MTISNGMYNGKMIVLAFPDTFVKFSHEKVSRLLPLVGLGRKGIIKAGHAAFILIENASGIARYFDFGRYITPFGYGRVRSAETDVELHIPFRAMLGDNEELLNLNDFLLWLEAHPEKTHGNGRLIASVCAAINFEKALKFVLSVQVQGSIPYYTFKKRGTNCSRIVTDTILAATNETRIIKPLLRNKKFTPSPLGNVEKASLGSPIYKVENGSITYYDQKVLRENITNYFKRPKAPIKVAGKDNHPKLKIPTNSQQLTGIGSSAYFQIEDIKNSPNFQIKRYNEKGILDFEGVFTTGHQFDPGQPYFFDYDSHCKYCHIIQDHKKIRFDRIEIKFPKF